MFKNQIIDLIILTIADENKSNFNCRVKIALKF